MELIKTELRRAFHNKLFLAAVFIQIGITIYHLLAYVMPAYLDIPVVLKLIDSNPLKQMELPGVFSTWIAMNTNAAKEVYFVILPLIAALPYGASLYLDERNHYVNNIAIRTNKKNYYIAKIVGLFVSGGTVAVIPMVLSLLANLCILPIDQPQSCTAIYLVGVKNLFGDLFYENPMLYILIYIVWVFLIAGLLTSFCFTATYIMENRFVIIMAPFILYFVTYVLGNMLGGRMALVWEYIQFNKIMKTYMPAMFMQILLLAGINLFALWFKCSKKQDVL